MIASSIARQVAQLVALADGGGGGGPSAPVFTLQPSSSSVPEGNASQFTTTATGALSYQWELDTGGGYADIDGATQSSLSYVFNLGDSGAVVRCKAANAEGTTTSIAATATITEALTGNLTNLVSATSVSRRIVAGYAGPLIRVINSGTTTQTDINADANGRLDETALLAARTGAEILYLHTIYDQSGNGRNRVIASETATKKWARVVDSSGNIEKVEGMVAGRSVADLSGPYAEASPFTTPGGTTLSAYAVHRMSSTSTANRILSFTVGSANDYGNNGGAYVSRKTSSAFIRVERYNSGPIEVSTPDVSQPYNERSATEVRFDGTTAHLTNVYGSGTLATSNAFTYTQTLFGGQNTAIGVLRVGDYICEAVIWSSDLGAAVLRSLRQAAFTTFTASRTAWSGRKVIWVGTSIPADTVGGITYPARLASALGTVVVNEAVGSSRITWDDTLLGTTYAGVAERSLSATVAELAAESLSTTNSHEVKIIGKSPDWVVLDHMVNDPFAPVGTVGSTDKTTFLGALQFVYNAVKADRPGVKFVLLTPYNKYIASGAYVSQYEDMRDAMEAWADGKSDVEFVDLLTILNQSAGDLATYAHDGTHPNDAGKQLIADTLEPIMLAMSQP